MFLHFFNCISVGLCMFWLLLLITATCTNGISEFVDLRLRQEPQDLVVVRGFPARFDCSHQINNKYADGTKVSWFKDGESLEVTTDTSERRYVLSNHSLVISKVVHSFDHRPDAGSYWCLVSHEVFGSVRSCSATLRVAFVAHSFDVHPESKTKAIGATVVLHCDIPRLPQNPIRWFSELNSASLPYPVQNKLRSGYFTFHNNGAFLEIRNLQTSDGGTYFCAVAIPARPETVTSRKALLTVLATATPGPLGFEMVPVASQVTEGGNVSLVCAPQGGSTGSATVSWLKGSAPVQANSRVRIVGAGSLLISDAKLSDAGIYSCRVFVFGAEEVFSQAELRVVAPPNVTKPPADILGIRGQKVSLQCVVTGVPQPQIVWLRNGRSLQPERGYQVSTGGALTISGLQEADAGFYQCLAVSGIFSAQGTAQLLVVPSSALTQTPLVSSGVVPMPSSVKVYEVGLDYVHLEWALPPTLSVLGPGDSYLVELFASDSPRVLPYATNDSGIIISDLVPEMEYTAQVYLQMRARGRSVPSVVSFRTKRSMDLPDSVDNLIFRADGPTQLFIKWEPPRSSSEKYNYSVLIRDMNFPEESPLNLTTGNRELLINNGIFPFRTYRVFVYTMTLKGRSAPAFKTMKTQSAKPSAPPRNFTVLAVHTSAILTWLPPRPKHVNGLILGYRLKLRAADGSVHKVTLPGDQLSHRLENLDKNSRFEVRLAAKTVNGTGPFTSWFTFYSTDREVNQLARLSRMDDADTALYQKILVPKSDIVVHGKKDSILLSWRRPVEVPERYEIYYGAQFPKQHKAGEIPGDQDNFQVQGLEPNMAYFISIIAYKDKIVAETTIRENTQTAPNNYYPNFDERTPAVPMEVSAEILDSRTAVLSWSDSERGSGPRLYEVEWMQDTSGAHPLKSNVTALRLRLPGLLPATEYSARVRIHAAGRVSAFSLKHIFKTKEEAPGSSPEDLRVSRAQLPRALQLTWAPPRLPHGLIKAYIVYYSANREAQEERSVSSKTSGLERSLIITGLIPSTLYYFKMRAQNAEGVSPPTPLQAFMTPDKYGNGGGLVVFDDYGNVIDSSSQQPSQNTRSSNENDFLQDKTWWFIIGGIFAVSILLIIVIIALVCLCRPGRQSKPPRVEAPQPEVYKYVDSAQLQLLQQQGKGLKPPDLFMDTNTAAESYFDMNPMTRSHMQPGHFSDGDSDGSAIYPRTGPHHHPPYTPMKMSSHIQSKNSSAMDPLLMQHPRDSSMHSMPFMSPPRSAPRVTAPDFSGGANPSSDGSVCSQSALLYDSCSRLSRPTPTGVRRGTPSGVKTSSPHSSIGSSPSKRALSRMDPAPPDILSSGPAGGGSRQFSTEDMTQEMASLEVLMQDLRSMTHKEFEC